MNLAVAAFLIGSITALICLHYIHPYDDPKYDNWIGYALIALGTTSIVMSIL